MIDWERLFLFQLVAMRMIGFVMGSPLLGRNNVPAIVKTGFSLVLAVFILGTTPGGVAVSSSLVVVSVQLLIELCIGLILGFVMRLFFAVVQFGGELIDAQMGLTMAQTYDASSQANLTITASLLNILFILNFFMAHGHYTLMRLLVISGDLLPYGTGQFGSMVATHMAEIFFSCMILSLKLAMPILAAELLGQIGMGILMKAIPQINAFVINIELKVVIGLILLLLFLVPINDFLLGVESEMLFQIGELLQVIE